MDQARNIIVCIDESSAATYALRWAYQHVLRKGDRVQLVNVLPPIAYSVNPPAPIATGSAVAAVTQSWEAQKQHDAQVSLKTLQKAKDMLESKPQEPESNDEDRLHISIHQLPATGGASGIAESVVTFCKSMKGDLLVLGSRGMGSFRRSIMGLVGLGSVSHYCAHHLEMPILIIRGDEVVFHDNQEDSNGLQVMFAMDEEERTTEALRWVCENILTENDTLHIASVTLPSPFLVADGAGPEYIHHTTSPEEVHAWEEDKRQKRSHAEKCCQLGLQIAQERSPIKEESRILGRALQPEGGASDVAASLCHYANSSNISLVAMGARQMGDLKRSMMNVIGLGSVSDYCVNNLHCPILLYKVHEGNKHE